MPQHATSPNFLQRLANLEQRVALAERSTGGSADEVPFYPTAYETMAYVDNATFSTAWETTITPRGSVLSMRVVTVGDQVSGVNSGGGWQMLLNSVSVWSGSVTPTFTVGFAQQDFDLTPYLSSALHIELQVRRTSGATTGGRGGQGGSIGISPVFARLL